MAGQGAAQTGAALTAEPGGPGNSAWGLPGILGASVRWGRCDKTPQTGRLKPQTLIRQRSEAEKSEI